jgi:hypothetical protein
MRLSPRSLVLSALLAIPSASVLAQDMDVPVGTQVSVLVKVIGFDRQLPVRAPTELVIGIAFQGGSRASRVAKEEARRSFAAERAGINGVPIRVESIDLDTEPLDAALRRLTPTFLYVTPLRAADIDAIVVATRAARVTTMTGVARYVSRGLAIGVALHDGRPRILVNLEAARLEGADLASELLKLATIVK